MGIGLTVILVFLVVLVAAMSAGLSIEVHSHPPKPPLPTSIAYDYKLASENTPFEINRRKVFEKIDPKWKAETAVLMANKLVHSFSITDWAIRKETEPELWDFFLQHRPDTWEGTANEIEIKVDYDSAKSQFTFCDWNNANTAIHCDGTVVEFIARHFNSLLNKNPSFLYNYPYGSKDIIVRESNLIIQELTQLGYFEKYPDFDKTLADIFSHRCTVFLSQKIDRIENSLSYWKENGKQIYFSRVLKNIEDSYNKKTEVKNKMESMLDEFF